MMKRNYIPFAAGMATMLLLIGLVGASLAGETGKTNPPQSGTLSGEVSYGQAGIALLGKEQLPAGTTRTTAEGAQVPTVLTYTDEKGEKHYYVEAETAAEVLDIAYGAVYREDLNCVDFGTMAAADETGTVLTDEDGSPVYWSAEEFFEKRTMRGEDGTERIIAIGDQKSEIQTGSVTITTGAELTDEEVQARKERLMETPTAPEYGVSQGIFTEVDPAEMDKASYLGRFVDGASFQGHEVDYTFSFIPQLRYAALVMENTGKEDILVRVARPYTVGDNDQNFSQVRVPAGKTLTRAFRIEDGQGADLRNKLAVEITSVGAEEVQVRLSSEQYREGVKT